MESIAKLIELAKDFADEDEQENIYYTQENGEKVRRIISDAEQDYRRWLSDTDREKI